MRYLFLTGKFALDEFLGRVYFNIKQIVNIKNVYNYNEAFYSNFKDFFGGAEARCDRHCSKFGKCVQSKDDRYWFCKCVATRFGNACNINKELFNLLTEI
jgi:hypothetical protein